MKVIRNLVFFILLLSSSVFADPPKAVIFDFGGVIGTLNRKPMLIFISKSLEMPFEKVSNDFSNDSLYQALKKPRSFWEKYSKKKLTEEWFALLKEREASMMQFIPGMLQLVETIKKQGIQVAILSNTPLFRANFIQSRGGYDSFDPVVLSCDVGVEKPSLKIYHLIFNKLELSPKACVLIDDRKNNIEAGEKLGMRGIRFKSIEQLKEELIKMEITL